MSPRDVTARSPAFLQRPRERTGAEATLFPRAETPVRPWTGGAPTPEVEEEDAAVVAATMAATAALESAAVAQAEVAALIGERLGAAVERLHAAAERLAADARTDALEVAFLIARRILDTELGCTVESMAALARSAVKRLGESRRIELRLSPADAQAIRILLEARGPSALSEVTGARIEVVADATLERGDCVVGGELGTVDGRLDTRLDELRRAVSEDLGQGS